MSSFLGKKNLNLPTGFNRKKPESGSGTPVVTPTVEAPPSSAVPAANATTSPQTSLHNSAAVEGAENKGKLTTMKALAPSQLQKAKSKGAAVSPPVDLERTEEYIAAAEKRMAEVQQLLHDIRTKKSKMNSEVIHKIFKAVGSTMPVLEAVASLHPISENVFKVFSGVYDLEAKRQEYDENVADVFYVVTQAMWSLRKLATFDIQEKMKDSFAAILQKTEKTLTDFVQYLENTYSQHKLVRVVTIHGTSSQLDAFKAEFQSQGQELNNFLLLYVVITAQEKLTEGKKMLSDLFDKATSHSESLKAASVKVDKSREQMNKMQATLTSGLTNVIDTIKKENAATQANILKRLDIGPHGLIEDEFMKNIWKEMVMKFFMDKTKEAGLTIHIQNWRNSIKCRRFLDAVQDRLFLDWATFLKKEGRNHPDYWCTDVLSQPIFYPLVGDVIDDNSSGFISVTELNAFLEQRPNRWSIAEWLTFWAMGWTQCITNYRTSIYTRWNEVVETTSERIDQLGADNTLTRFIGETDQWLKNVVGLLDYDYEEDIMSLHVDTQIHRLNTVWEDLQEAGIAKRLEESGAIGNPKDVQTIMGKNRIELSLMPLIYVWVSRFLDKYGAAEGENHVADLVTEFTRARNVFDTMLNRRLGELVQIWAQQKQEPSTQVKGYCSGIFVSYFEYVFEPARQEKKMKQMKGTQDSA